VKSGKSDIGMLPSLALTAPLPVLGPILPPLSGLRGLRCVIIGQDERQAWCVNITYAQLRHVVMLPSSAPHHEEVWIPCKIPCKQIHRGGVRCYPGPTARKNPGGRSRQA
jgi:hypothetical protein